MTNPPLTNAGTAAVVARKCWRTFEPFHGMIYFVPEAAQHYDAIGVEGRSGYFGSRSAPMGAVGAKVVQATFFNFHPGLVDDAMDGLWERTTPEAMLLARHEAVDDALRRMLGDDVDSPAMGEAVDLLRPAVEAAEARPEGRPLFAGHARLPEPDMPHLALWRAITLLREFRGDGHIAALVDAELSGVEALVLHAASGEVPADILRSTRAWPADEWAAATDRLRSRGLIEPDDDGFTDDGRALRDHVEARTDALAAAPWRAISEDDAERARSLVRPWSKAITAATFA